MDEKDFRYIILDILQAKSGTAKNQNEEVKNKGHVNVLRVQIRLRHFELTQSY